jgi:hypothetical protein
MSLPRLEMRNGRPGLTVDGQPFLILGLQWDCDACFSTEEMSPLFPHARRMGANTAVLPTYWRALEPETGRFDFAMVDEAIAQARAQGMRLILLWFAAWKNASPFYAPDDIRKDHQTYRRARDRNGAECVSLCPTCEATFERDRAALLALMRHLAKVDGDHCVITVQLENESGIIGSDRCYCPECKARFVREEFADRYGTEAGETFSAVCFARYVDRLAAAAKAVLPLPLYTNVWLTQPVGRVPGSYPSGGAMPHLIGRYREELKHLDFVAPDIYTSGATDFDRLCRAYGADGNALYIAEHSSAPEGRAERNAFYAFGKYGAIGFDPWAIDAPYPDIWGVPLVDSVGYEWGPQAYWLRDSYVAIGRAMVPIARAQGTDRLACFVQEAHETAAGWSMPGCELLISYHDRDRMGRGLAIRLATDEFILVGVGYEARFSRPVTGAPIPIISAEWGRFEGERWHATHPIRRQFLESEGKPIRLLEPGVARIVLDMNC